MHEVIRRYKSMQTPNVFTNERRGKDINVLKCKVLNSLEFCRTVDGQAVLTYTFVRVTP